MKGKKDYYRVLGIDKKAPDKEIRRAYRRLARKYHPDLNQNDKKSEARFKEISEAYEVLSDQEKRQAYDNPMAGGFGMEDGLRWDFNFGGRRAAGSETGGFGDISDLFGDLFGKSRGPSGRRGAAPPEDTESEVTIPLELAYSGGTTRLSLSTQQPCRHCRGQGHGQAGLCGSCLGRGIISEQETVRVKIPAGVYDGAKIRLPGRGAGGQADRGDLYLQIHLAPHPRFQVEGRNLISTVDVLPWEAALGGSVTVDTLAGSVRLKIPPATQSGKQLRLRGRGLGKGEKRGDLLVEVRIQNPPKLSQRQRELFEELRSTVD